MTVSIEPKGTTFTRLFRCLAMAKDGGFPHAAQIAEAEYGVNSNAAVVLRAATDAGSLTPDATWGGTALSTMRLAMAEFYALVREQAIVGRMAGLRRVPLNVSLAGINGGATAAWVGEREPKPVSEIALTGGQLPPRKIVAQIVVSAELVRMSGSEADALLRAELVRAAAEHLDTSFVDPSSTEITGVRPASVTSLGTVVASSGNPSEDLGILVDAFRGDFSTAYWIMHPSTAVRLALARDSAGAFVYPDLGPRGGSLLGMPVLTSRGVPADSEGGPLALIDAGSIAFGGGETMVDSASHASIVMNSDPDDPDTAGTVQTSLWQRNLSAIRCEITANWRLLRPGAVAYVSGVNYSGGTS